MSLRNVKNTAMAVPYERPVSEERVWIEKPGTFGPSQMTHYKRRGTRQMRADFDIEIDVEKIAQLLIRKAQGNTTGKAGVMGGLITVKRRNVVVVSEDVRDVPVPEGWSERA